MPKPISRAEASTPRIVIVTMDEEMLYRMTLRRTGDELEDRIKGISEGAAA